MLPAAFAALALIVSVPTLPSSTAAPAPVVVWASEAAPARHAAPSAGDDVEDGSVPTPTVAPDDTLNEFLPEDRGLSDCLGLVERPGCGSEARGGWRQTLVFAIVVLALAFIVWRIVRASRRARPRLAADADADA